MGVLGLTPFIQKYCPEVIKELPHRLRSLSGKTIAIDGTLITQRLHFAPMSCENRHILGWYRLIRELKDSGVGVICVFDGEERSRAKQHETERRRRAHRTDIARGAMELERSCRLRRLTALLTQYQALPDRESEHFRRTLHRSGTSGRDGAKQKLQHRTHSEDKDIFWPANESLGLESTPPSSRPENRIPAGHDPKGRVDQDLRDSVALSTESPLRSDQAYVDQVRDETQNSRNTDSETTNEHPTENISQSREYYAIEPTRSLSQAENYSENLTESSSGAVSVFEDAVQALKYPHALDLEKPVVPDGIPPPLAEEFARREEQAAPLYVYEDVSESGAAFDLGLVNIMTSYATEPPEDFAPIPREGDMALDLANVTSDTKIVRAAPSSDYISHGLLSLYQDYQQSVPTFMSPLVDTPIDVSSEEGVAGARERYMMSKNQAKLTVDEGNLWDMLMCSSSTGNLIAREKLQSLAQRSDVIFKSYEKRNNPPTLKTYEETKLILRSMGVPYIESAGPYEAEALAASLVHHGLADYVASEDTDVLVYEAPLLRNITNRQSPLTLLSGAEVRQVLQLNRASYVDFALLLGTDFSQRIKNLGPQRAIKLIRAHGCIEHVIAKEPKFIPRLPLDAYLEQVGIARLVFETLPPVPDIKLLRPTESDDEAVAAILDRFGVHRAAMVDWDFASALDGNYFDDNPTMD